MTTRAPKPPAPILGVFTPEGAVMAGVLALAFVGLFYRWFYTQHLNSSTYLEDWGHAYVVPLISGYLIYRERDAVSRLGAATFWPALAPLLLGIMCYFFFVASRFAGGHMVQGWAMVLTLLSVVVLLLGPAGARLLFVPVVFLVFGITISERIMLELTFPMKLLAAQGAYLVMSVIGAAGGFSVDVSGTVLTIINSSGVESPLDVADACSGMWMLVAFFALAGATGILGCAYWWQRVALLLLAAPVGIIVNIGRVAVLGILTLWNPNLSTGSAHTLIGTLLLIPGMGLFMLVVWALNKAVVRSPAPAGATP